MSVKQKPWGYEYLFYSNDDIAVWHLVIDPWQQTSLHAHPNKKTGLVVLDGAARVGFLNGQNKLFTGEKVMIRQGVFHQTKNMTSHLLHLFEIETPVDKADIVRLKDAYGRSGQPYGNEKEINRPQYTLTTNSQKIGSSYIKHGNLKHNQDYSLLMLLDGKIYFNEHQVAGPGDILDKKTFNELTNQFDHSELYGILIEPCYN